MTHEDEVIFKAQILLVDDCDINLLVTSESLKAKGFSFLTVTNSSKEALELFKKKDFDLVILDYLMPEMRGDHLIEEFLKVPGKANVPVILLTAANDRRLMCELLAEGTVWDYVFKPFNIIELVSRVKNVLLAQMTNRFLKKSLLKKISEVEKFELILPQIISYKNNKAENHLKKVSKLVEILASDFFSGETLKALVKASQIHDIGEIGVPDSVLTKVDKADPLSEDELLLYQNHCLIGQEILERTGSSGLTIDLGKKICLYHHENWNGTGFPYALKGEEIPLEARFVSIADFFDTFYSKKNFPLGEILEKTKESSGKKFDPKIVQVFEKNLGSILEIYKT